MSSLESSSVERESGELSPEELASDARKLRGMVVVTALELPYLVITTKLLRFCIRLHVI
jgi:hypothetical protein